ncbi:MAG TPA: VOC family protein [Planctomycetota bacterium]|jgi:glyoxylase I family protein
MTGVNEGFHHVAIKVHDFDAAVKFYTAGLGFNEKLSWGEGEKRAVLLDAGNGNYVEIFAGGSPGPKPEGSVVHFAFRSTNCDAAIERAQKAGAEVTMQPKNVEIPSRPHKTPVRIAFCKGPAGEVIEFFQNELT